MDEFYCTLKEFVERFCRHSNYIRVESAFNGKCLAKNYHVDKNEDLDKRMVTGIGSRLATSETKDFAVAYILIYVDGSEEYEKTRERVVARGEELCATR